jgi:alpha-glucosidase
MDKMVQRVRMRRVPVLCLVWVPVCLGLLAAGCACVGSLQAQTLAHKGWAGSGLTVDPWWSHAVFYEVDPLLFQDSNGDGFGDLNGIASRLDYLQALGVDAAVLSPFPLEPAGSGQPPFEPRYGTEDDFDKLEQEASLHKIRLLVDLPLTSSQSAEQMLAMARFWLSRGVAGLRVTTQVGDTPLDASDRTARLRALRKLCSSFMGERVLMVEALSTEQSTVDPVYVGSVPVKSKRRHTPARPAEDPVQLKVDQVLASQTLWNPEALRVTLFGATASAAGEVIVSDTAERARSWYRFAGELPQDQSLALAKMLAAVLFLGREEPMLFFGQEIGMSAETGHPQPMQWGGEHSFTTGMPWVETSVNEVSTNVALEEDDADSLLNWYRQMSKLRHEDAALHRGTVTQVETGYPDVVAWVRKGTTAKDQPVLVVCNVSAQPRLISVADSLHRLGLSTTYGVRAVALSIQGMDPSYAAAGINLPAYGVYVGELRQPGLEDAPAPVIPHHRHY